MVRRLPWVLLIFTVTFTSKLYAADQGTGYLQYSNEPVASSSSTLSTFSYVAALLVTFCVVIGLAYFTSRLLARKVSGVGFKGSTKVLEVIPLGTNRAIYVLEMVGKVLVVGVTEQSISVLDEINDEVQIEKLKNKPETTAIRSGEFEAIFERQLRSLQRLASILPDRRRTRGND